MRKYNGAFAKPILNIIKEISTKIIPTSIPGSLLCLKGTQRRESLPSRLQLLVSQRKGFGMKATILGIFFSHNLSVYTVAVLSPLMKLPPPFPKKRSTQ